MGIADAISMLQERLKATNEKTEQKYQQMLSDIPAITEYGNLMIVTVSPYITPKELMIWSWML